MGLILDLDLTLVDSSCAEASRRSRRWPEVYKLIGQFPVYDGVPEFLKVVRDSGLPTCIVTSSPTSYCSRVLKHLGVEFPTVCYHDTWQHKPHPAPIVKALELLGVSAKDAISVGDDPKDVVASKAAGVFSVAAPWGCASREALLAARPDFVCESVFHLLELVKRRFGL